MTRFDCDPEQVVIAAALQTLQEKQETPTPGIIQKICNLVLETLRAPRPTEKTSPVWESLMPEFHHDRIPSDQTPHVIKFRPFKTTRRRA